MQPSTYKKGGKYDTQTLQRIYLILDKKLSISGEYKPSRNHKLFQKIIQKGFRNCLHQNESGKIVNVIKKLSILVR